MRYALWSRGRLLGHTELDLACVQDRVRMGFIDPTEQGIRLLPDATGVPAAAHALARAARRAVNQPEVSLSEFADFRAACDRREALQLELRDEADAVFPCEWIQVNDIDDHSWADGDFDADEDEPLDPELEAAIEHDVELIDSYLDGDDYERTSSWEPPDGRWDTMKYHVMVYLGD
jgi:hypothetical protein